MRRAGYLALCIIIAAVVGWKLHTAGAGREVSAATIPTTKISRGSLVVTLPANGVLESAEELPVRSEIAGALVELCEGNRPVQVGDPVYRLDTKDLLEQRDTLLQDLSDAQEELSGTQADNEVRIAQAQSEADAAQEALKLAQAQAQAECEKLAAQVRFAEGELARAERELARYQRLAKLNYIPGTRLREAEKAYSRSQFDLEQMRVQEQDTQKRTAEQVRDQQTAYELTQHALVTARADAQSHLEDVGIRVAEAQRKLDEVDRKIQQCTVLAPAAGMVVIETNNSNWPERRPYRLGDQVQVGAAPVQLYDIKRMRVRCQIGEMDISRVHQGQEAYVYSADLGKQRFRGKVTLVEELAQEANVWQGGTPGKKVFTAILSLLETDPAHLRPGMTVDLEIVLDSRHEAILAPIQAVFREQGETVVFAARGTAFARVPVELGARSDLLIEVKGKVSAGDRVALERPPDEVLQSAEVR